MSGNSINYDSALIVLGINFLLYLVPNSEIRKGYIIFFRDVKRRCSANLKRRIGKMKENRGDCPETLDYHGKSSSPESPDKDEDNSSPKPLDMNVENSRPETPAISDIEVSSLKSISETETESEKNYSTENQDNVIKTKIVTLVSTESEVLYITTQL